MSSEKKIAGAGAAVPLEIQIEIIKRLPVKSLLRFTQVSKQWKSIIKSPLFISDYNKRTPLNHLFVYDFYKKHLNIFDDDITFLHRITAPMAAKSPGLSINQSIFGISCSQGLFGFIRYPGDAFILWNPSIRKSVCIPVPENKHCRFPRVCFTVCNGTDPTIFRISRQHSFVAPLKGDIFKLSTGDWTTFSVDPPRESLFLTPIWEVIDRFIYWLAIEGDHYRIISFDIISQQLTEICLLPSLTTRCRGFQLGLSRHKESLVVLQQDVANRDETVWMMMMEPSGVQNSFKKLYTVKAPPYSIQTSKTVNIRGFRENGKPIIAVQYSEDSELTFLFYEPDLERFNDIQISGYGKRAGSYTETLLLLDH